MDLGGSRVWRRSERGGGDGGAGGGYSLVLLLPFAWAWRAARERAIYRLWLAAAVYPLLLAATRLLPPTESQLVYLAQFGLTALYALGLWAILRRGPAAQPAGAAWQHGVPWALAGAGLFALPWIWRGALGFAVGPLPGPAAGACVWRRRGAPAAHALAPQPCAATRAGGAPTY